MERGEVEPYSERAHDKKEKRAPPGGVWGGPGGPQGGLAGGGGGRGEDGGGARAAVAAMVAWWRGRGERREREREGAHPLGTRASLPRPSDPPAPSRLLLRPLSITRTGQWLPSRTSTVASGAPFPSSVLPPAAEMVRESPGRTPTNLPARPGHLASSPRKAAVAGEQYMRVPGPSRAQAEPSPPVWSACACESRRARTVLGRVVSSPVASSVCVCRGGSPQRSTET